MPLLFKDYTDLVLKAYEEKRNANLLSRLLMQPTTANIRQDCLNVYNDRINKGQKLEENILTAFFGVPPAGKNFGYVIARYPPDKFRPFQKFIKGEIKNPSLATVELLAWLIDFNPRPLAYAQRMLGANPDINSSEHLVTDSNEENPESIGNETDFTEVYQEEPAKGTENPTQYEEVKTPVKAKEHNSESSSDKILQKRKLKIAVTASLIFATLLGGGYMLGKNDTNTNMGCMYWSVDHYEPVSCNEKGKGLLVPLDEEKIKSFRKIMRKDTITEWSIGKLYYIKNDNDIECYTEAGNYPLNITRYLKVVTQYIYDKYLRKNSLVADSSVQLKTKSFTNR